jgi:formate dehydrogenase maturation protein FdhE
MKHKIIIDKENKVLKLQVSIPKKTFKRDPNVRFYDKEAWEMVKNTKVEGYTLEFKASMTQLDNYALFRHEGEFVFPMKEMPKKTSRTKKKPPAKIKALQSKPKRKTKSKAGDAKN